MARDPQLETELAAAMSGYAASMDWERDAYRLVAARGNKRIEVTWPYPLLEAYFDFTENEQKIFSDWVEFYDGEPPAELRDYIAYVIKRFLDFPSRVEAQGRWLETPELQICEGGTWVNLFD